MTKPVAAKLLIVEDMSEMRDILRRLLGVLGYANVTPVTNGAEAWEQLQLTEFDVVLCDWNMPKMSGRELLEKVRATPRISHIPFIMITGESAADMVRSAIAGGVTDFIVKPFTASLLDARLRHAMTKSRHPLKTL